MSVAVSADGTRLAYDHVGSGPPLILAAGAFNSRSATAPLAQALAGRVGSLNYDRRGRGDSGDTPPYAVEREIEDLAALLDAAGGRGAVFGYSSGATLVLRAAAAGLPIDRLVLYEPPFNTDAAHPALPADLPQRLAELVVQDRRGDAVELYQSVAVGMPDAVIAGLRAAPFRPGMEAIAHTLAYDAAVVGDRRLPTELLATITVPVLVVCGGDSPPFMRAAAAAAADAIPDATLVTLPGQGHAIDAAATAAAIVEFVTG